MLLRRVTEFLLQGRVQAMSASFLIAFIPLIGSISVLIAMLVTLRKGAIEGLLVLIAASLPFGIKLFFHHGSVPNSTQIMIIMMFIIIASNILTWFLAIILRQFNSWNVTLEFAALFGVLLIGVIHLIYPDIANWWVTKLNGYFAQMAEITGKITDVTAKNEAINGMKHYMTGLSMTFLLTNALFYLLLARGWQAIIFNPGGLKQELYQVRLSYMAGTIFLIGLILGYFNNEFALDEMPILYLTFFIAGMCLLHKLLSVIKHSWIVLLLLYAVIVRLLPISIMIIALIALVDTGLDFRKRFLIKR